ncbi:hypothetical protein [Streptomyces sp. NPDC002133]|uniref:hypothetical protein n=1 Tax=Streptomyces sp. NPDC002133 TaxID=3154409 RepID=UPI0033236525
MNQAKEHPEPLIALSLGRGSDRTTTRLRLFTWYWEHGGRHLRNAKITVLGWFGWQWEPDGQRGIRWVRRR